MHISAFLGLVEGKLEKKQFEDAPNLDGNST